MYVITIVPTFKPSNTLKWCKLIYFSFVFLRHVRQLPSVVGLNKLRQKGKREEMDITDPITYMSSRWTSGKEAVSGFIPVNAAFTPCLRIKKTEAHRSMKGVLDVFKWEWRRGRLGWTQEFRNQYRALIRANLRRLKSVFMDRHKKRGNASCSTTLASSM